MTKILTPLVSVLKKLLLASIMVLAPIKAALIAAICLTAIDLLSGLIAAKKRGEALTSSGLKRTIVKILVYELVIVLGFITELYLIGDMVPVTKILTGYIGITELKSVLENIEDISGVDLLKQIINRLQPPSE